MTALSPQPLPSRNTVLVIEDDHDIRVSVRSLLEDEGYEVHTVTNGLAALSALEHGEELPCVIVLDLMLPVMDGWDFAERVRKNPRLARIPIVIMSAYDSPPPPAGAVAFIKKPVNMDALLRAISPHCG